LILRLIYCVNLFIDEYVVRGSGDKKIIYSGKAVKNTMYTT